MSVTVHELEIQILSLSAADRARLLERLIDSFDRDSKVEQTWLDEALRREQTVLAGETQMVPGREAVAQIRAQLS